MNEFGWLIELERGKASHNRRGGAVGGREEVDRWKGWEEGGGGGRMEERYIKQFCKLGTKLIYYQSHMLMKVFFAKCGELYTAIL